ncbi:MAG: hypothetical protein V3V63_04075 [Candidatus Hydrothermarchaeaceae archaeon]
MIFRVIFKSPSFSRQTAQYEGNENISTYTGWIWSFIRKAWGTTTKREAAGSIHNLIDKETMYSWIKQILASKWQNPQHTAFALSRISRLTGDRERDIDEKLRGSVVRRLKEEKCDETFITPLLEVVEDQSSGQSVVLGESLPSRLVLKSGERCFREDKQL